ncbi:hypothetical protein GCM10027347_23390 [Larkinella harenae]
MPQTIPPHIETMLKNYRPRVIVKFGSAVRLPYEDGAEKALLAQKKGLWSDLQKKFPGVTLRKIFDSETEKCYRDLIESARLEKPAQPVPDFFNYFYIDVPEKADRQALMKSVRAWQEVVTVYEEGIWVPADPNPRDSNPYSVEQRYLDAAPLGIDARFTQRLANGDGSGIQIAHVDSGWLLAHEDLNGTGSRIFRIPRTGTSDQQQWHGTATMGVLAAADNSKGGIGIVPNATFGIAGIYHSEGPAYYAALAYATQWCRGSSGSIMLITSNLFRYSDWDRYHHFVPVESELMVYEAIRFATTNHGTCVIASAGESVIENQPGLDLDTYTDEAGTRIYNRSTRDSGAILVAAATSDSPHRRLGSSNYGYRIDAYAWGENIRTTGSATDASNRRAYTSNFGGTSGAAAIVAGAAAAVQGMAKSIRPGGVLAPSALRNILSDQNLNTPSANPGMDRIGVMPDLKRIAEQNNLAKYLLEISQEQLNAFETMERLKHILAFYWLIFGSIRTDGPGWVIPGGSGGGPVKLDPWSGPVTEFQKGVLLLQFADAFGESDAATLRKIGLETIQKASAKIGKA